MDIPSPLADLGASLPQIFMHFWENLVKSFLLNTVLELNVPLFNNISLITSAIGNNAGSSRNYFREMA